MGHGARRWTTLLVGLLLLFGCAPVGSPSTTVAPTAQTPSAVAPSPEASVEQPVPLRIEYDHYLIPELADGFLDEAQRAYYRRLVDAFLVREESFDLSPEVRGHEDAWRASALFGHLNPLGSLGTVSTSPDGMTQMLDYYFDEAEHASMVSSIAPRIEGLVADLIPEQANDLDAVAAVYQHLASTTSYTQDGPLTGAYGVLIDSSGMCGGFASGMSWLLAQAGFDIAYPVEWTPDDPEVEGHAWALVELDGHFYHFDPTWENDETGGLGLRFFGMTDAERISPGTPGPFAYLLLDDVLPLPEATDERFLPLRDVVGFMLDPVQHLIVGDGAQATFSTSPAG